MEASAYRRILVREITEVHGNYSVHADQEPGLFSLQLILDDGAEEHSCCPAPRRRRSCCGSCAASTPYFDIEKRVITLGRRRGPRSRRGGR